MKFYHVKNGKMGGSYEIVGHCVIEETGEPAVLYTGNGSSTVWCRPAAEFFDGRFQSYEIGMDMTTSGRDGGEGARGPRRDPPLAGPRRDPPVDFG